MDISAIGGLTSNVIGMALDGLSLRQEAIASNIANSNSIGYRPAKVSFEQNLADYRDSIKSGSESKRNLPVQVSYDFPVGSISGKARLDESVVMLNQNTIQYHALIKGLEKYISNIALATQDGRR